MKKRINLPTKITIARIVLVLALLVALFVFEILGQNGYRGITLGDSGISLVHLIACVVFVIASATDALDGYLARKWNQVTDLGKFLDPIADKMLVNSLFIFLAVPSSFVSGHTVVPVFCVILMVLRDLIVDTLRFLAASKGEVLAANIFGKLKTVAQMVAIPFVLLNGWPFSLFDSSWGAGSIAHILVYIATLLSLVSGVIYVVQNRHVLASKESEE